MKRRVYRLLVLAAVIECCMVQVPCNAKRIEQIQELYKKIGDELISVRKQFAGAQPMVYTVLDQLDKMNSIAKSGLQRKQAIKKALKEKESENIALKKSLEKVKNDLVVAQQTVTASQQALNEINQKFETEKEHALLLAGEKDSLVEKIKKIAETGRQTREVKRALAQNKTPDDMLQSLTRSSTSEPSSSR